jgi:transketolase
LPLQLLGDAKMKDVLQAWKELAAQLRVDSIRCSTAAGSGHPTSSLSAAELMAVLVSKYLKYDWNAPENPNNDRLIFSKGHASPLLYSIYKAVGAIDDEELMTYRRFGSRLQGHPNPRVLPWVEAATGSLGQGIGIGVGMAINGKYLDELPYRTWVLLGDSEMAESSVWEAFDKASYYQLNHLIAIIDMNRLGQRGETELGWDAAGYANRCRAFGWNAIELNGHDLPAIDLAFAEALAQQNAPSCLNAKTILPVRARPTPAASNCCSAMNISKNRSGNAFWNSSECVEFETSPSSTTNSPRHAPSAARASP